ncbi:MAG: hypothetical protein Q9170_004234, partial [Blastenia crenularia]
IGMADSVQGVEALRDIVQPLNREVEEILLVEQLGRKKKEYTGEIGVCGTIILGIKEWADRF